MASRLNTLSSRMGHRWLNKLRGRSIDEVRVRAAQALQIVQERWAPAASLKPIGDAALLAALPPRDRSAAALLDAFRAHAQVGPIPGLRNLSETRAGLSEGWQSEAIGSAETILQNRFVLFGTQEFDFGTPIDWHREPRAGLTVPLRHWSRIAYLDPEVAGDKKITWELNRHQYFITLGRAYVATSDERYASAFAEHVQSWIAKNPPKQGINWTSALEVSYRSIAWMWALLMFRTSRYMTPSFFMDVVRQIELHGRHIDSNLSTYFSPNTHLTGEALGLYYIGAVLPFLPHSARWRGLGRDILVASLRKQVRADGTYFENATYYHRYALDIYANFAVLAEASGEPLDGASMALIEALADALSALIKPDGTHGLFGDDDGGRLLPLDTAAINDFRPSLSNAAILFSRPDFKVAAGAIADETVWLLGARACETYGRIPATLPPAESRALLDGGFFIMKDGGGPGANHLVIDCGPHGAMNCGHAHADALAFELAAYGRSILMDAGTYTYTGEPEARRAFRGTAYHNALTVDRQSSSEPAGPFTWHRVANCRLRHWRTSGRFDVFEGEHDGFERLPQPVAYRRHVLFIKGGYWIVRDHAASDGWHDYAQHFHFAPDARPLMVRPDRAGAEYCRCSEQTEGQPGLDIASFAGGGIWALEDGWVSTCYGEKFPAKAAIFAVARAKRADIVTFMLPRRAGHASTWPKEVAAKGGRAFQLASHDNDDVSDVFAIGRGARLETDALSADAAWLWLRTKAGRVDCFVAHEATSLMCNGETLLQAPQPVNLMLWRAAPATVVECDNHVDFEVATLGASVLTFGARSLELATGQSLVRTVAGQALV